jgi:O-antigen/teichoic acid export membrane protein
MSPPSRSGYGRMVVDSIPAVLDQALFATTSFTLVVLLAHAVGPDDFGAFTLWLAVLMLLGTVYASVVIDPTTVYRSTLLALRING